MNHRRSGKHRSNGDSWESQILHLIRQMNTKVDALTAEFSGFREETARWMVDMGNAQKRQSVTLGNLGQVYKELSVSISHIQDRMAKIESRVDHIERRLP